MDPSSGEEEWDGLNSSQIAIFHEFKPGLWGRVGAVTIHRAHETREPVLKLGDVREMVGFPMRVDSEIDKEHKDKGEAVRRSLL